MRGGAAASPHPARATFPFKGKEERVLKSMATLPLKARVDRAQRGTGGGVRSP
jgi:hypothetical protein